MTQEQKELLLKDLCARLPYKPKIGFTESNSNDNLQSIWYDDLEGWQVDGDNLSTPVYAVKPYLFPFSSMTDEQEKEYLDTCNGYCTYYWTEETFDWLNKNHFDYRNLIEKGLALDATGLNIY